MAVEFACLWIYAFCLWLFIFFSYFLDLAIYCAFSHVIELAIFERKGFYDTQRQGLWVGVGGSGRDLMGPSNTALTMFELVRVMGSWAGDAYRVRVAFGFMAHNSPN